MTIDIVVFWHEYAAVLLFLPKLIGVDVKYKLTIMYTYVC